MPLLGLLNTPVPKGENKEVYLFKLLILMVAFVQGKLRVKNYIRV